MRKTTTTFALLSTMLLAGCGEEADPSFPNVQCDDFGHANCVLITSGDSAGLLDAVNALEDDTAVILGTGTYELDNQVTIRANRITITGQGMEDTVLSFGTATTQINGIDAVSNGFLVQDLTVLDAKKDAIRVENSDGVTYRRVLVTWTNEADPNNGIYGIYPVRSRNVLVEDSIAERASDAGLYVGQSINVIVRNNVVRGNVAGLEIENTQYADVYGNLAENNTAGIVVFDLPGNPIIGRDVRLRDNMIVENNHPNFATPGTTVAIIPAGTGTFAMASRRVEITGNTYMNNQTGDIAVLSGLVVDPPAVWELPLAEVIGEIGDLDLPPGASPDTVMNFRTENILISGNTHSGGGTAPDTSKEFAVLLVAAFGGEPTSSILYDTFGESMFDAEDPSMNSNDNHICAGGNTGGNGFASLHVEEQLVSIGSPILVIDSAPFAPFDCTDVGPGGPVAEVTIP